MPPGKSAGGAATAGGMNYQYRVTAWVAVQVLAEKEMSPLSRQGFACMLQRHELLPLLRYGPPGANSGKFHMLSDFVIHRWAHMLKAVQSVISRCYTMRNRKIIYT